MKIKLLLLIIVVVLLGVSSCVKDINLDQVDNFSAEPKYIASLVYFKVPAIGFLDSSNNELSTAIVDETRLTVIEEEIFQKYLIEASLDFEIRNPFNRSIRVELQFLDDSNNVTYLMNTIIVPANTNKFVHKEVISIGSNPQFLNSRKVRASLQLVTTSGSAIDANDLNEFEFKSAGTFTFKI
ncbi:hypothetical protein [uncultured Tenacibaculum sp.]|uniref:hypothetical protein n=1 Tax=uncultured Tenacibaculum sp. TaxID=174713 RepID=UPI002608B622|nr:hypothetical protein [uncultured Tenacibaculum sp.]